jgi:heme-degrading monooxygenase HmoA
MIARIWRTAVEPTRAAEYLDFARRHSLPMFRLQPGFKGALFAARDDERAVITFWDDLACVDALNDSDTYAATVAAIESAGFLRGRSSVEVFDVEEQFFASAVGSTEAEALWAPTNSLRSEADDI